MKGNGMKGRKSQKGRKGLKRRSPPLAHESNKFSSQLHIAHDIAREKSLATVSPCENYVPITVKLGLHKFYTRVKFCKLDLRDYLRNFLFNFESSDLLSNFSNYMVNFTRQEFEDHSLDSATFLNSSGISTDVNQSKRVDIIRVHIPLPVIARPDRIEWSDHIMHIRQWHRSRRQRGLHRI